MPNDRPSKQMKAKLTELKGEIESSKITVGDFNTTSHNNRQNNQMEDKQGNRGLNTIN